MVAQPVKPSHRIARLALKVNVNSAQQALSARMLLRDQLSGLAEQLEAQLDTIVGEGDWLHIPSLAISITQADFNVEQIIEQIKIQLVKAVTEQFTHAKTAIHSPAHFGLNLHSNTEGFSGAILDTTRLSSLSQGERLQLYLQHYLATGALPWHAESLAGLKSQWQAQFDEQGTKVYSLNFPANFAQWLRLAGVLNVEQLDGCLTVWQVNNRLSEPRAALAKGLVTLILGESSTSIFDKHKVLALLGIVLTDKLTVDELNLVPWLEQFIKDKLLPLLNVLGSFSPDVAQQLAACLRERLQVSWFLMPEGNAVATNNSKAQPAKSNVIPIEQAKKPSFNVPAQDAPAARINWAGLGLLYPYLPRLFGACDIDVSGGSIPAQHLPHAARLMVYLASGEHYCNEYELGTVKLLLGLTLDTTLPLESIPLANPHIEQCDSLLKSFISHWAAIKNTSVNGVRSAFLQREGYAKRTEQGWSIFIERNGYDALLDQLPFSLSMVKLPWMKHALQIEW